MCRAGLSHRWRISEPNGPTSRGVCKHCGETRQFANSDEYAPMTWGGRTMNQLFIGRDPLYGERFE